MLEALGPVKYAAISVTTSATAALVTAPASGKIRVLAVEGAPIGPCSLTFFAATTALCGAVPVAGTAQFVRPFNGAGWYETGVTQALNMVMSSSGLFAGSLVYQLVK